MSPARPRVLKVLLVTLLAALIFGGTASVASADRSPVGVYRGANPAAVSQYQSWLGTRLGYAVDFVGRSSESSKHPWQTIDRPRWWCDQWSDTSYKPVFSVAILPTSHQSLAAGASGAYNGHWRRFARVMVARGCGNAVLRLGWEFNSASSFPWAAKGKEAKYAAYWRRIVKTVRKVPGTHFSFDWCPLARNTGTKVKRAYPGNHYVDTIGLDTYDTAWKGMKGRTRWQHQVTYKFGLAWQRRFAKRHHKQVSYPEWGLTSGDKWGQGGNDNPAYIRHMYRWFKHLPKRGPGSLAFQAYFEYDAPEASHRLMSGRSPKSAAVYRKLFGRS